MIKDLVLKKYFSQFLESWSIECKNEKQENEAFEKFVNYIILSQDETGTFVGRPDLLDFCGTGGNGDAKLDGIGIKINGQLVGSTEEIDQVVASSKKIEVEFFLIQAKERPEFDANALTTFSLGVTNFFSDPTLPENDKVKNIRSLKDYIYNTETVYRKCKSNPTLHTYFVFCGVTPDDDHTKAIKKLSLVSLDGCNDCIGNKSLDIIDSEKLISYCRDLENEFSTELNVRDIIPLTVNDDLIEKAYVFTCDAIELLKLLTKEDGTIRRSLFNDNVRDYLGGKSSVNTEIENTIKEEPDLFLMCNNGITIVCSDFRQVRNKNVCIDNPQIVNGCQTCNSIFVQRDNDGVKKVQVLVKLICTERTEITNKIVRGTNKQNQVYEESFETTNVFHQRLEEYFEAKNDGIRMYYERRNKQYSSIQTINKYQIVNLKVLTQTFVATFMQLPHEAHRHEAKLLEKYAGLDDERRLFKSDHSYLPYYISALIWYKFEDAYRRKKFDKSYRTFLNHLYFIYMFIVGQYPLKEDATHNGLEKYCDKLEKSLLSANFDSDINKVIAVFNRANEVWQEKGNSRDGVKDNSNFTDLLTSIARDIFLNKSQKLESEMLDTKKKWLYGEILSFRMSATTGWFSFIKQDNRPENIYFNSQAFAGEIRNLTPGKRVKYLIATRNTGSEVVSYATEVVLI